MKEIRYNPIQSKSQLYGKIGYVLFEHFVTTNLGWIVRKVHQEDDYGIDAFIDIVKNGVVTGKSVAIQIKCGDSYFDKTAGGYKYIGEKKHLNYYLNHNEQIILIILTTDGKQGFWAPFDAGRISPYNNDGWWLEIPKGNKINVTQVKGWGKYAGNPIDFSKIIEDKLHKVKINTWATDHLVEIKRQYIEENNIETMFLWQHQFEINKETLLSKRGKCDFYVGGWDDDPEPVWQKPVVREWFSLTVRAGFPWFYWLSIAGTCGGYVLLLLSMTNLHVKSLNDNKVKVEYDGEQVADWLRLNFDCLNHYSDFHKLGIKIIKEMSANPQKFIEKTFKEKR